MATGVDWLSDYDWKSDPTLGPIIADTAKKEAEKLAEGLAEKMAEKMAEKLAEGLAEKMAEKMAENARAQAERRIARSQIEQRFGPLDQAAVSRLDSMSLPDIENLLLHILTAASIKELLR